MVHLTKLSDTVNILELNIKFLHGALQPRMERLQMLSRALWVCLQALSFYLKKRGKLLFELAYLENKIFKS